MRANVQSFHDMRHPRVVRPTREFAVSTCAPFCHTRDIAASEYPEEAGLRSGYRGRTTNWMRIDQDNRPLPSLSGSLG